MVTRVGAQTPVYCLSDGPQLPSFATDAARRKALKEDAALGRRIEVLQDFEFPEGTSKTVRFSGDGTMLVATGEYPPAAKVFDLSQLGQKYERRLGCECVDVLPLSPDLGKMVFLLADRTLDFHAPYGTHFKLRVPTAGRALVYDAPRCHLLVAATGGVAHRLDLDAGAFLEDLKLASPSSCCAAPKNGLPLVGFGCEDGVARFFDARASLDAPVASVDVGADVTALAFDVDGMRVGAGTADARVSRGRRRGTSTRAFRDRTLR